MLYRNEKINLIKCIDHNGVACEYLLTDISTEFFDKTKKFVENFMAENKEFIELNGFSNFLVFAKGLKFNAGYKKRTESRSYALGIKSMNMYHTTNSTEMVAETIKTLGYSAIKIELYSYMEDWIADKSKMYDFYTIEGYDNRVGQYNYQFYGNLEFTTDLHLAIRTFIDLFENSNFQRDNNDDSSIMLVGHRLTSISFDDFANENYSSNKNLLLDNHKKNAVLVDSDCYGLSFN